MAMFDGGGTGLDGRKTLTRLLDATSGMVVHHVGPADLRPEVLEQFDLILFPGGSGSRQAAAIGEREKKRGA